MRFFRDSSFARRFLLIFLLASIYLLCYAQFAGGDGTENSPYQVATAEHLNNVRNHLDSYFIQTDDIDLDVDPYNEGEGWVPIGTAENPFLGNYNGDGHIISGLFIDREANEQALFGYLGIRHPEPAGSGFIRNLGLIDVDITGNNTVAGIAANINGNSVIEGCFVTGSITGASYVGGINGRKGCNHQNTHIYDCYSTARIRAAANNPYAGGISGYQYRGTVQRCYATGPVIINEDSPDDRASAVVGYTGQTGVRVHPVYWNEETTLMRYAHQGFATDNHPANSTNELRQRDTYEGFTFPGTWLIDEGNSYPYHAWQEEAGEHNTELPFLLPPRNLLPLGVNQGINVTWEDPSVGEPNSYNVYRQGERVNDEPVNEREFLDSPMDNGLTYSYTVTAIYDGEESRHSYPANGTSGAMPAGSGTEDDPYLIATPEHLANTVRQFPDAHFRQIIDLDLDVEPFNADEGWDPIGEENPFTGVYDGNFKKISGLYISRRGFGNNNQALFHTTENATLKNIILTDVDILGHANLGGLVGRQNGGTISQCYVSGSIRGNGTIGGIAGYSTGTIENSVNMAHPAAVNTAGAGRGTVGGIMGSGSRDARIVNSFSAGPVSCNDDNHSGIVHNDNPTVTNSYWDVEASGVDHSLGGEGRTSSQMTRSVTFENWDFDDVWQIREGETYPFFRGLDEPFEDDIPTPAPTGLIAFASNDSEITLNWEEPSIRPRSIRIYRNNNRIASVDGEEDDYIDRAVNNFTQYQYHLIADHGDNRLSAPSPTVYATPVEGGFAGGRGTANSPYLVATAQQLDNVRYNYTAHYRQIADIDLDTAPYNQGAGWEPIGGGAWADDPFTGSYDGGNFTISGMQVRRPTEQWVGLFGFVGRNNTAVFRNIILEDAFVQGNRYIGGLLGHGRDALLTVENVRVEGVIEAHGDGRKDAGGLIGESYSGFRLESTFTNCSTHGTIRATDEGTYIGAMSGYDFRNDWQNCYTTMTVSGHDFVSGFIGYGGAGSFTNCYAMGRVTGEGDNVFAWATRGPNSSIGNAANCYWDVQTSGQEEAGTNTTGITGRTTEQMTWPYRLEEVYINWDFEEIWRHDEDGDTNNGYPYLYYEPLPPIGELQSPVVQIDIVVTDEVDNVRLRWEEVANAESYRIYASDDPKAEDWGNPIRVLGAEAREYIETVSERGLKFYRITASPDAP